MFSESHCLRHHPLRKRLLFDACTRMLRLAVLTLLAMGWLASAHAAETDWPALDPACKPQLRGTWAARELQDRTRPAEGWEEVTLPDRWKQRWPEWHGVTWYRVDWELPCSRQHLALFISGIRQAGVVYWGDELVWRDRNLQPPYSRGGNLPRVWPVSTRGDPGMRSVWIRVIGQSEPTPGLGDVLLDDAMALTQEHARRTFRQHTVYLITSSLSLAIGLTAVTLWLWRRSEHMYLWFGLMHLCWSAYLSHVLLTEPWPWLSSENHGKQLILFFMLYANCFSLFSQRFLGRDLPRLNFFAWSVTAALFLFNALTPYQERAQFTLLGLRWAGLLFSVSAIYAIVIALRTRKPEHLWLAACWTVMLVVGVHDIIIAARIWQNHETWSSITGPVTTVFLAGLMGWKIAGYMRRIDGFNMELHANVTQARAELAQVLEKQEAQAVENAKLQERAQIAHDLHDGLGGNLVRSMALVAHAPDLSQDRVMSMFKVLRDDLRQVIDSGSSATTPVPKTPRQWLAPLRHRLTMILDELGIATQWQIDEDWKTAPTAIQCLAMARFVEEAFSNIIKHSRARHVRVVSTQPCDISWQVVVEDDGVGFDVATESAARLGIGMQSMRARLARTNGSLEIQSQPGQTVLSAHMLLVPSS